MKIPFEKSGLIVNFVLYEPCTESGMKKIAFIVNAKSGTQSKDNILAKAWSTFSPMAGYQPTIHATTDENDAYESASDFARHNYDIVVAIGGDGTVNQVARALVGTETKLAIIPVGSGNGLARHLRIPLLYFRAIDAILEERTETIDAGRINDKIFFCTAGLGFDAEVGSRFNNAGTRGLKTYIQFCAQEYVKYRREKYTIRIGNNVYEKKAFLITFANGGQWGNNAFIAPEARIADGLIDVVIWNRAPLVAVPFMTAQLFTKTLGFSEYIESFRCKEITIEREKPGIIQFDGESAMMPQKLTVSVIPNAVKVIVPSGNLLEKIVGYLSGEEELV